MNSLVLLYPTVHSTRLYEPDPNITKTRMTAGYVPNSLHPNESPGDFSFSGFRIVLFSQRPYWKTVTMIWLAVSDRNK